MWGAIAVCFGHSPPPRRRAARRIARPAKKTSSSGWARKVSRNGNETRCQGVVDMRVFSLNNPDLTRGRLALESEPTTIPKLLTEPESTQLLERLQRTCGRVGREDSRHLRPPGVLILLGFSVLGFHHRRRVSGCSRYFHDTSESFSVLHSSTPSRSVI